MLPRRLRRLPPHTIDTDLIVLEARGLRARLLGLALLREPPPGVALLIPRCSSVHTFGMRFPLDLVFYDARGRVVRIDRGVPPKRVRRCPGAWAVLELPAGVSRPSRPDAAAGP
ncbi:MAG: DUF192 domain-containing protein [Actinomycetota bacterium]|nr:DUF192 domain-containing protein [Actinomycetota bacterium]